MKVEPETTSGGAHENRGRSYAVVTPVRNEADYLGRTIASMMAQTTPPVRWIIVDDGSTDDTAAIVEAAMVEFPAIRLVRRTDRGHRLAGTGVMQAFEEGRTELGDTPWDYLVKLDGDLEFGPDYFETCLGHFDDDATLGIAGGKLYDVDAGRVTYDPHPAFHVRGATKIYRRECWDAIGGLTGGPGWDTLDEAKANQMGWSTRSLADAPLYQLRPTGRAAGTWSNWVKNGDAAYRTGYHPAFILARAGRRLVRPPSLTAPTGLIWGYARSWAKRTPRIDDPDLLTYVRTQQWNRLTRRPSMWR
jgi:glycosyltransferase involved in cell wall biosynthesis